MEFINPFLELEFPYEQIIWASTQKSINTGASGFGLRTHSSGLTSEEAAEIAQEAMVNYSLPTAQKATESDIVANPLIEDKYPSLYTFREVSLRNGKKVWVVGRTLYVVSDYGFFADIDSARRDGSNYIAHLAVFNEKPSPLLLAAMIKQDGFMPADKRLTPSNAEIRSLLVGDPQPLPAGSIKFATGNYDSGQFLTDVALGLITAKYRETHPSTDGTMQPKKLVVRLDNDRLPDLLSTIWQLPEKLVGKLQFQANTMYYSGVPENLDMIVVPSQNTTPIDEEFFIVADYTGSTPRSKNLMDTPLFGHIRKFEELGLTELRDRVIKLCINGGLDEPDPELAYWCMMLLQADSMAKPGELTPEKLVQLLRLRSLSPSERTQLNAKINDYLNSYFIRPYDKEYTAGTLREGLDILNTLRQEAPDMVRIYPDSVSFVTDMIFAQPQYLGKLFRDASQNERLDAALYILNEADSKVPAETVLESLSYSENPQVWRQMLKYINVPYSTENHLDVLSMLAGSPLPDKVKSQLAREFYDPIRYRNVWMEAMEIMSFDELRRLGISDLIEDWLFRYNIGRSLVQDGSAELLLKHPEYMKPDSFRHLSMISSVAAREIPDAVTSEAISEAIAQHGPNDAFSEELVKIWLSEAKKEEDFVNHLSTLNSLSSTKNLARWFEAYCWPHLTKDKNRQRAVGLLIDKVLGGKKEDIIMFSDSVSDKEIADLIKQNSGFGASLKRKFSGIFGKK